MKRHIDKSNILFTSAGRRGYLLRYFKDEIQKNGLIHATNSAEISTSFIEADKFVVSPLIYSENYLSFLFEYCKQNLIKAIIPLFDIDLPVLASHAHEFLRIGVIPVCSSVEVANICNDKWQTYQFLKNNGFLTPKSYIFLADAKQAIDDNTLDFPVILKPRWGMGSIGLYLAENIEELNLFYAKTARDIKNTYLRYESKQDYDENIIIQETLSGTEYGLDVVNDLAGKYMTTFIKKKIAMRAGETDAAVTVRSDILSALGEKLSKTLGHVANLDVDLFMVDGAPYVLEMNARFGGGYPFSHMAGANLPRAILSWVDGKEADHPSCFEIREGVVVLKSIEPRVYDSAYEK